MRLRPRLDMALRGDEPLLMHVTCPGVETRSRAVAVASRTTTATARHGAAGLLLLPAGAAPPHVFRPTETNYTVSARAQGLSHACERTLGAYTVQAAHGLRRLRQQPVVWVGGDRGTVRGDPGPYGGGDPAAVPQRSGGGPVLSRCPGPEH
jgi:hypothetical protein